MTEPMTTSDAADDGDQAPDGVAQLGDAGADRRQRRAGAQDRPPASAAAGFARRR